MSTIHQSQVYRERAEKAFLNQLDSIGWTMTGEYLGLKTPVEVACPQGHTSMVFRDKFNSICRTCMPAQSPAQRRKGRYYAF